MNLDASPTQLLELHRLGDAEAARLLFELYSRRLCRLAEQHLSRKLAGRMDGEDAVQSAFRTFFQRTSRGEFQIDSQEQLWQLLATITVRKVREQSRRHTAASRDVAAEQPAGADDDLLVAMSRDPGPDEAALLIDQIETLLHGLPENYGQILHLRLQGHSVSEIAVLMGIARQTVYRTLDFFARRLTEIS